MKLPVSNKTASFDKKPRIKKGFYPAKFMGYKATKNDGSELEGQYGKMIILEFAIFEPTKEGTPNKSVSVTEGNKSTDVVLDKFAYITYKDKKSGEHQTAFTPNSKPTKMLKALGWEPDFEGEVAIDLDALIGNWVEVLVDDYLKEGEDVENTCSSIGDLSAYEGEKPSKEANKKAEAASEKAKPKSVKKQVKHEDVKEDKKDKEEKKPMDTLTPEVREKVTQLQKLKEEGLLTEGGFKTAMESLGVDCK